MFCSSKPDNICWWLEVVTLTEVTHLLSAKGVFRFLNVCVYIFKCILVAHFYLVLFAYTRLYGSTWAIKGMRLECLYYCLVL
ncbi:hypothetical protein GDO86_017091 [Hymenochirus boettgeri]|uniref:Uncharacterized protein n=1 Tax=Hymenochirus boettgeri TaxID=247094 RepID=A0A8T2ILN4_9PIPI|nr:hypothetical protein GDO86_017091 [Hymenochirus boettgeri]